MTWEASKGLLSDLPTSSRSDICITRKGRGASFTKAFHRVSLLTFPIMGTKFFLLPNQPTFTQPISRMKMLTKSSAFHCQCTTSQPPLSQSTSAFLHQAQFPTCQSLFLSLLKYYIPLPSRAQDMVGWPLTTRAERGNAVRTDVYLLSSLQVPQHSRRLDLYESCNIMSGIRLWFAKH